LVTHPEEVGQPCPRPKEFGCQIIISLPITTTFLGPALTTIVAAAAAAVEIIIMIIIIKLVLN